jgi:hypothetical protein
MLRKTNGVFINIFVLLFFILSFVLLSACKNEGSKSETGDQKSKASDCSVSEAKTAAKQYLKSRDIDPASGYLDYYENLSDPAACSFTFYGAFQIGDAYNGSIENIYVYSKYRNGQWVVNIEY